MPEDKPYIQKLFGFMQAAFGLKGKLSPGAFTNDLDTFVNKITTNPKYADKIHTALHDAYGTKGKVKKGAFTTNAENFRAKVLAPQPMQAGGQFDQAQRLLDFNNIGGQQPSSPDPSQLLLQTAADLELPETKQPGIMTSQQGIEPLVKAKADEDARIIEEVNRTFMQPRLDPMRPGEYLPLTEPEIKFQERLEVLYEQDKNLKEQQEKADAFYNTRGGKLYYDFVRPIYQSFLNVGKNVSGGTVRLAGDVGGSFGLDDSQRILGKTADGIVDYFDFNRLAREGNPTGYLNLTPTAQQGKLSGKNLVPKAVEAISSMATLMGGGRVLGGNAPALFTSSFMSTYEDYRKKAKQAGLSNNEADRFALTSAGVTSVLEMISPNRFLLRPGEMSSAAKGVFKAIKDGVPVKQAVKNAFKQSIKEIGKENIQELSQAVGDKVIRGGTDLVTGQNRFNEDGALPSFDETLETIVLTSIATGVMSGRRFARNANASSFERSAWAQAAERPEIIERGIANGIENGTITEEQGAKISQDVADYKQIYDALNAQISETNPNADISRVAFDAFQSQRLKKQQQPIQGIPALAPIQQQNDQQNAQLENNIQDELIGVPEEGAEITSGEVKDLMSQSGGEEKVSQVSDNDYKVSNIDLVNLFNTNEEFKNYVEQEQLKPSENEDGLRIPVVINNDGKIVDGLNRLAQQYINGSTTARAFVETNNTDKDSNETILLDNENKSPVVEATESTGKTENENIISFKTAKGSIYTINGQKTIRNKAAREEHPGDYGLQEESALTVYLTDEEAGKLSEVQSTPPGEGVKYRMVADPSDGKIGVRIYGGPNNGKIIGRTVTNPSRTPSIGLTPLEIYRDGKTHFGNKIIELTHETKSSTQNAEEASTSLDDSKKQRDEALEILKKTWSAYGKMGIINNPEENIKRDKEFYSALANYVRQELLYRVNKVKGYASRKKSQMKRDIIRAVKSKGLNIDDVSLINDAFEDAYKAARDIPGFLADNNDRVSYKDYIKDRIRLREKSTQAGVNEAATRVQSVKRKILSVLKGNNITLSISQIRKISNELEAAVTSEDIDASIEASLDKVADIISSSEKRASEAEQKATNRTIAAMKSAAKAALREGREKGKIQGTSQANSRVRKVRNAMLETVRKTGIKIGISDLKHITSLLQSAVKSSDVDAAIENVLDVTSDIVWRAKNKTKISTASKLIKDIRRLKSSESMVVGDVEWLKMQQLPAPSQVSDLDEYIQFLEEFNKTRRGNKGRPDVTKKRFQEFIDQENAAIYSRKRKRLETELQQLKNDGIVDPATTLDDYIKSLEDSSSQGGQTGNAISKKQQQLIDNLGPRLKALKLGQGEFRGSIPGMDADAQKVANELTNIKVEELSVKELILLNNILNNIIETGSVDGAGGLITSYQAKKELEKLEAEGIKIRQLPSQKVINKKNISNIFSALFYNDRAIASFREKVLGGVENKVSHVKWKAQNVVKQFVNLAKKHGITPAQNARLHAISYLNQFKGSTQEEIAASLTQKLNELIDDASYMYQEGQRLEDRQAKSTRQDAHNRLEALASLGFINYTTENGKLKVEISDDLLKNRNLEAQLTTALNELTPGEKELYDFVLKKYADLADRLEFVTRTYANKEFKRERNYVSQVSRRKDGAPEHNPELSAETDITQNQRSVNAKPSGTTMTRTDKKGENIYYDGDFFSNFVNRYYQSLYTAEVLPDLQKAAKIVNNEKFRLFITGALDKSFRGKGTENYSKFKNKFIQVVNDEKYAPFFKRGKSNIADALISRGVRLVLGNIWQAPKQYAPAVIHNFSVNNPKAVTYAMRSKGRALVDPEYRRQRAEFLKNFTGVQRSATGSEAYDKNVKRITEDPSWWMKPVDWLDKIQKVSSFALERADRAAQNDAYIASYITSLIKQGQIKRPGEFDIVKESKNPNKEALAYAEQMASNINNESARAYRADVLTQGDYSKYLWLLQGFSLNAYQNAMNKAKIIGDNRATSDEKIEAAKHFMGYLGEMGTYQLVGKWARNSQLAIAAGILSSVWGIEADDDEEKKKNKKEKENIRTGAGLLADITLSGLPAPAQAAMKIAANYGYQQWAKIQRDENKKEAKSEGKKYDARGTHLSPYYVPFFGADGPGGAADFYTAVGKKGIDQIVKAYNEDDKDVDDTAAQKVGSNLNTYMGIPAAALGLGDLVILNNRMQQVIKDSGKKDKSTGAVSGSGANRRRSRSRSRNRPRPSR